MNVWDQQPHEGGEAFAAFNTYLNLGNTRTLDAAYRAYRQARNGPTAAPPPGKKALRAPGGWKAWYQKHGWRERAATFDRRGQAVVDRAREAALQAHGAAQAAAVIDYEAEKAAHVRAELELKSRLLEKINGMLEVGLTKRKIVTDPKTGQVTTIILPAQFTMATVVNAVTAFAELGRLTLGMPHKIQEAPPDVPEDLWWEKTQELSEILPEGVVQPMPPDPTKKPAIDGAKAVGGDAPQKPAKRRPG